MIVKIQKSLSPPGKVLIYNKNRSFIYEGNLTAEVERFVKYRHKIYAKARVVDGRLEIIRRVKDESW